MRDHSLDLLKGVACVLMLLAHTQLQIDLPSKALTFLGSFAPILFFAVSGITAHFQAAKYPPGGIILTYAMIFLLGLSFAALVVGDFWAAFDMDILQIIALGVLALYLVQRYLRPGPWVHLSIAVGLFALKLATDTLPRDPGWVAALTGWALEPGNFVLLPWLFPFFLGMFGYLAPNRHNLWAGTAAVAALALAGAAGVRLGIDNRWDMSIGYFLCSVAATTGAFYVARRLDQGWMARAFGWLLWLGRNSLPFLYLHIGVIWLLRHYTQGIWGTYWVWPAVAAASLALLWLLPPAFAALRLPGLMSRLSAWGVLLALILAAPLALPAGAPLTLAELTFGLVFSLYYPALTQALKGVGRTGRGVAG